MNQEHDEYWRELGINIAEGNAELSQSDILAIASKIDFSSIKPELYPTKELANRNTNTQKRAAIKLVEQLWGIGDSQLMNLEQSWLSEARRKTGKTLDDDKDEPTELVTPQILAKIIAVAYLHYLTERGMVNLVDQDARLLCREALKGLNIFIANSALKGRTRFLELTKSDGNRAVAYNLLRENSIAVGATGMFLPYPEKSLPHILLMFQRSKLDPNAYLQ